MMVIVARMMASKTRRASAIRLHCVGALKSASLLDHTVDTLGGTPRNMTLPVKSGRASYREMHNLRPRNDESSSSAPVGAFERLVTALACSLRLRYAKEEHLDQQKRPDQQKHEGYPCLDSFHDPVPFDISRMK